MPFRTDINGLRALAVLAVVLYHFDVFGFQGGFIGVDIFFVISGFLMTRIIVEKQMENRFSFTQFMAARTVFAPACRRKIRFTTMTTTSAPSAMRRYARC